MNGPLPLWLQAPIALAVLIGFWTWMSLAFFSLSRAKEFIEGQFGEDSLLGESLGWGLYMGGMFAALGAGAIASGFVLFTITGSPR